LPSGFRTEKYKLRCTACDPVWCEKQGWLLSRAKSATMAGAARDDRAIMLDKAFSGGRELYSISRGALVTSGTAKGRLQRLRYWTLHVFSHLRGRVAFQDTMRCTIDWLINLRQCGPAVISTDLMDSSCRLECQGLFECFPWPGLLCSYRTKVAMDTSCPDSRQSWCRKPATWS
jgi:hypothetical protein